MITDIANLGPPLKGSTDLISSKKAMSENSQKGLANDPDSFAKTLSAKKEKFEAPNDIKMNARKQDQARDNPAEKNEARSVSVKKGQEDIPAKAKGQNNRERVILEFMDSMESEFGIPPTKIVDAMAQLSDLEMTSNPEDTASQVIEKLDLNAEDKEKALAMYMVMLGTLSQLPNQQSTPKALSQHMTLNETNPAIIAGAGLTGAAMMSAKERRALLNKSLDGMNQKFFMQESAPPEVLQSNVVDSLGDYGLGKDQLLKNQFQTYKEIAQSPKLQDSNASIDLPQAQLPAADSSSIDLSQLDLKDPKQEELAKGLATLGLAATALNESVKGEQQNSFVVDQQMQATPQVGDVKTMMNSQFQSSAEQQNFAEQDKGEMTSFNPKSDFFVPQPLRSEQITPLTTAVTAAAGTMAATANSDTQSNPNIQQIMNQTQYMIKKGGGEAIVKMNPEGLGQVHLKVILQDGKVNMQMATETKEAKQAIESSIGELKNSLSHHKISLDTVKVDVGNQLASDNNSSQQQSQQNKAGFQQDMQREQARQFLHNFREQNSGRDGFYEMPGVKAYGPSRKSTEALQPTGVTRAQSRYAGTNKGSGLDLVA